MELSLKAFKLALLDLIFRPGLVSKTGLTLRRPLLQMTPRESPLGADFTLLLPTLLSPVISTLIYHRQSPHNASPLCTFEIHCPFHKYF